ncbi:MAG: hypothetical protein ABJE47_03675 [bacterium]
MNRTVRIIILGSAAVLTTACADKITSALDGSVLASAFTTSPLGFESMSSSFSNAGGLAGVAFMPDHGRGGGRGPNGLPGGFDFMGGGFGDDFLGGPLGGGRPFEHGGPPSTVSSCVYAASTGVVTCGPVTHDGLTIASTVVYKTAAGVAQAARDSNTNSVTTHVDVSGSLTRRDNIVTTVKHSSDQAVAGLASTSTQRTVNGTSAGTESTTGKDSVGTFAVTRVIGDTTSGIVIPLASGKPSYPTAGSVIRSMQATVTYAGKSPTTSARREVVTYDGSATAKLVITQDGTTKTCTVPLPHGRPTCS